MYLGSLFCWNICVQVSTIKLLIWGKVEKSFHPLSAMYQYKWQKNSPRPWCCHHHVPQLERWKLYSLRPLFFLSIKLLGRRHLAYPREQWQISVELEGDDLEVRTSLTHFIVDSDAGVSAISRSWLAWGLVVLPKHLNQFPPKGDSLALCPDVGKVITHPNNFTYNYLKLSDCFNWWSWSLHLFINGSRWPPQLEQTRILPNQSSPSSLDFPIVLTIGQSSKWCQTNPFHAGKDKVVVNHDLIWCGVKRHSRTFRTTFKRLKWVFAQFGLCWD